MNPFTERDVDCFAELRFAPNVFSLIVRGHLYCESALASLIRNALKKPDELNVDRLGFQMKVNLAAALGLIPTEYKQSLAALSALRNRYVHQLDYEVTESDQSDFMNTFKSAFGPAAKYMLRRGTEFPGGLRRTILALWISIELAGLANREAAISMMAELTMVAVAVHNGGLDVALQDQARVGEEFVTAEFGSDKAILADYRQTFSEVEARIRSRFPRQDAEHGPEKERFNE